MFSFLNERKRREKRIDLLDHIKANNPKIILKKLMLIMAIEKKFHCIKSL